MKKSTAFLLAFACLLIGCFGSYVILTEFLPVSGPEAAQSVSEGLDEIYQYLNHEYYQEVDLGPINEGAYKGAVTALGDPYSEYMTKAEYEDMMVNESGDYSGIGVTVSIDVTTGYPYAVVVHKGAPAEKAGVQVGDIFMAMDGEPIDITKSLNQMAMELRGEEGSVVTVTVYRDGTTLDIPITRGHVVIDKVEYRLLEDGLGYIKITEFYGNVIEKINEASDYMEEHEIKGLVLDLRDNPGGYVDYATAIADALLPEGDIVTTVDRNGNKQTVRSDKDHLDLPIAVLMNAGSASASEILAGALKDHDAAEIVGVTSFGKALVQRLYPLNKSDGFLKITIATYYTPDGHNIHGKGIEPDYVVELNEEQVLKPSTLNDENDTQLKKAIEVVKEKMK